MTDRVVLYHNTDQAKAALAAAAEYGEALTLVTAPGAARYAGPSYLATAFAEAGATYPEVRARAWIDCGEDADLVLRAIKAGWRRVVFNGQKPVANRVADICAQQDVEIQTRRAFRKSATVIFDLGDTPEPMTGMRNFFMSRRHDAGDITDTKARLES